MAPVQKLEAAIAKLEAEARAPEPGPWGNLYVSIAGDYRAANETLVETLRRTIDAQLELLKKAWDRIPFDYDAQDELVLADAILGEDQ